MKKTFEASGRTMHVRVMPEMPRTPPAAQVLQATVTPRTMPPQRADAIAFPVQWGDNAKAGIEKASQTAD